MPQENPLDVVRPAQLERLPMFPLPRTVLFPGVTLPLHLFEPRYRELAEHCVTGDRLLALAALKPGYEDAYLDRPPVFEVMGLGRIVAEQRLPDGRWNIALRGLCRVEILAEHPPTASFREVHAKRLESDPRHVEPAALDRLRGTLIQLASRVQGVRQQLAPLFAASSDPAALTDIAAALFVESFAVRRELLEQLSVAKRLAMLEELLAQVLLDVAFKNGGGSEPVGLG
ncbi:MAG: LON peptidase substrate-binding domain-containing protein [Myxococcales bacterium]|nr:LON peptidase substrate-binding domain-containing protein [Myxococcales bacterium]MCB9731698.1 LON peptidase substrate-binding domain-containing protein [Deltaproteobacteria bacterium]